MKLLPKQKEFVFDIKTPQILYVGGYGSGKTTGACIKAMVLAGYNPRSAGMLVSPTFPMLRDTTRRTFLEILETNEIGFTFRATENKILMHETGSEVWFRSADDPTRLKGSNLAWCGLDEPALMHKDAYLISLSRLREPKAKAIQLFLTGTHEGFSWLYDEFETGSTKKKLIRSSTEENTFLPTTYIESLYENYDDEMVKQYIKGYATLLNKGRVYYCFDRLLSIKDNETNPAQTIKLCVDFNVNPLCWCIVQTLNGIDYVTEEVILRNSNTEYASRIVKEKYPNSNIIVYGDASGNQRHTSSVATDYEIMKSILNPYEVRVKSADPLVINRINAVNSRLKNAKGERRLFVNSNCKTLIRDFEQVIYKEGKREIDKSSSDLTHVSDAVGYYIDYEYSLKGKPIVYQRQ